MSYRKNTPGKEKETEKAPRRLEIQPNRSPYENLADLPRNCDWGNSNGKTYIWKGYKLHLDCTYRGAPISAIVFQHPCTILKQQSY